MSVVASRTAILDPHIEVINKAGFQHDFIACLERRGILSDYVYSDQDPNNPSDKVGGSLLFRMFKRHSPNYYPPRDQADLLKQNLDWLYSITGQISAILDMGSGDAEAIQHTSIPVGRHYRQRQGDGTLSYVPVDISSTNISSAASYARSVFQGTVSVIEHIGSYFSPIPNVPEGKRLVLSLGASQNVDDFPEGMKRLFEAFKKAAGHGGYIAISVDTNHDQISLDKAYDDPFHERHTQNVLYLAMRELDIQGDLNPEEWKMVREYETRTYTSEDGETYTYVVVSHMLEAKSPQSFFVGKEGDPDRRHFAIPEGYRITVDKSCKPSVELMDALAAEVGLRSVGTRYHPSRRMALPVYAVT